MSRLRSVKKGKIKEKAQKGVGFTSPLQRGVGRVEQRLFAEVHEAINELFRLHKPEDVEEAEEEAKFEEIKEKLTAEIEEELEKQSPRFAKLHSEIENGENAWNAREVYKDPIGGTHILKDGYVWNKANPLLLLSKGKVDDVVIAVPRDDRPYNNVWSKLYWVAQNQDREPKYRIVKLTEDVSFDESGNKWEATLQYISPEGDLIEWKNTEENPAPILFDEFEPIFTSYKASVGDIILVIHTEREDGTKYWASLGSGSGGGGGSSRVLVQNKTLVTGAGGGDWELLNADDKGTFADEAALLAAHAAPTDNMYAKTTDTGTYWIASGGSWRDTGQTTKASAGIEGVWTTQHKQGVVFEIDCEVGTFLWLDFFNGVYYAEGNFAAYRGEE